MITPRILAVDLGAARIGLAISDELGLLAHPLATIPAGPDAATRIAATAADHRAAAIVVGLPLNMDGSCGPAANAARAFADALRARTACRVVLQDERLSTVAAQRQLQEAGRSTKKSRHVIDQAAAQIILQAYLDSTGAPPPPPPPE